MCGFNRHVYPCSTSLCPGELLLSARLSLGHVSAVALNVQLFTLLCLDQVPEFGWLRRDVSNLQIITSANVHLSTQAYFVNERAA